MNSIAVVVAVALAFLGVVAGNDVCQAKSPCVYQTSEGHFLNLNPIKDITTANDESGTYSFQFNPCRAFTCNNADALACDKGLTSTNVLIPKGSTASCMKRGDSVALQYKTDNTSFTVTLECSQDMQSTLKYQSGSHADADYKFILSSRYACEDAAASTSTTQRATATSTGTTKTTATTTGSTKTSAKSTATTKTSAKSTGTTKTSAKSTGTTKTSAKTTGTTKTSGKTTSSSKTTGTTGTTKTTKPVKTTMKKSTMTTPSHTTHHSNASANAPLYFVTLTALTVFINRIVQA